MHISAAVLLALLTDWVCARGTVYSGKDGTHTSLDHGESIRCYSLFRNLAAV